VTRPTPSWPAVALVTALLGCGPNGSTAPQTAPGQPTTKTPDTAARDNPAPQTPSSARAGAPEDRTQTSTKRAEADTRPHGTAAAPKASEKDKPGGPMKVTAEQLTKAFTDDEKAAKEKYRKGMPLEITGVVYEAHPIDRFNGTGSVDLRGHLPAQKDEGMPPYLVICAFGEDKDSPGNKVVAALTSGQTVTLRGVFVAAFKDFIRIDKGEFIVPRQ
jgi:hypothetical protein